jgi:hypothetical protein
VPAWPFLLEVMHHVGFSHKWTDWTSTLLSTVSTGVCLNGAQGNMICHGRGLRQGDTLSRMLFVLVMEVLDALFHKAGRSLAGLGCNPLSIAPHYMMMISSCSSPQHR